jgi:Damage-control phosphatase ARMT1-like domain
VFRENNFSPQAFSLLKALDDELAAAAGTLLTPIADDGGPDVEHWNTVILAPSLEAGETWLSAPWSVSEFYFYRRLMTAIDYFREPVDPFASQKQLGLSSAAVSIRTLAARVNAALATVAADPVPEFLGFVLTSLWGNRMDLSLWPVGSANAANDFAAVIEAGQEYILSDNSLSMGAHVTTMCACGPQRFDVIVDNAGFELFCDLCLADFLASSGLASIVYIHLKAHPTFVSDAMAKDVMDTIDYLRRSDSPPESSALGQRWNAHVQSGRWILADDFFWAQPTPMWKMPPTIAADLSLSTLVFVKGDANYRRLLGDCAWPLDTPFEDILCYFPAPVCALRTLKAELGCGMLRSVTDSIAASDKNWLTGGRYGVVQFLDSSSLAPH